ncbi:MAG: hypothetical protein IJB92_01955 [Clostridia bacterium]|nr:hypothetical protein [Clostridia bacterium]MBQ4637480.1 hypothetical protein [Clostridia bacterium]
MTGRELLESALALMAEDMQDAADYEKQAPALIRLMMTELFDLNNSVLVSKEKAPLVQAPTIADLAAQIEYEDEIVLGVMPYGLAAKLSLDDDRAKAAYFNAEYLEKRRYYLKTVFSDIVDIYTEE